MTFVQCTNCRSFLKVDNSLLGSQLQCGACKEYFFGAPVILAQPVIDHSGKAVASIITGGLGMILWCLPILGLPITVTGLILGLYGLNSTKSGLAAAGITLSIIGLVLTIINAAIGAYLGATGQHSLFN